MKRGVFILLLIALCIFILGAQAAQASYNNLISQVSLSPKDSLGEQRVGVFLIDYVNDGNEQTREQIVEAIFRSPWSINNFVQDSSYNKTWLTGDVFGWVHLTEEERYCWPDEGTLLIHFQDQEIDFQQYERFFFSSEGKKRVAPGGLQVLEKFRCRHPMG